MDLRLAQKFINVIIQIVVDDVPPSVKALVGCKKCVGCKSDVGRKQPVVQIMVSDKL